MKYIGLNVVDLDSSQTQHSNASLWAVRSGAKFSYPSRNFFSHIFVPFRLGDLLLSYLCPKYTGLNVANLGISQTQHCYASLCGDFEAGRNSHTRPVFFFGHISAPFRHGNSLFILSSSQEAEVH